MGRDVGSSGPAFLSADGALPARQLMGFCVLVVTGSAQPRVALGDKAAQDALQPPRVCIHGVLGCPPQLHLGCGYPCPSLVKGFCLRLMMWLQIYP